MGKAERSKRRDLPVSGETGRSQSPHSTAAAVVARRAGSKPVLREGGQEGGCVKADREQESIVSAGAAKQGAEAREWSWAEASVWTERMVSALENGVKGGRWFSLVDKSGTSTASPVGGCGPSCASSASAPASAAVPQTTNAGPMPSSHRPGCSPCTQPGPQRDTPDEETTDWRAVCGKTARTV